LKAYLEEIFKYAEELVIFSANFKEYDFELPEFFREDNKDGNDNDKDEDEDESTAPVVEEDLKAVDFEDEEYEEDFE